MWAKLHVAVASGYNLAHLPSFGSNIKVETSLRIKLEPEKRYHSGLEVILPWHLPAYLPYPRPRFEPVCSQ